MTYKYRGSIRKVGKRAWLATPPANGNVRVEYFSTWDAAARWVALCIKRSNTYYASLIAPA